MRSNAFSMTSVRLRFENLVNGRMDSQFLTPEDTASFGDGVNGLAKWIG